MSSILTDDPSAVFVVGHATMRMISEISISLSSIKEELR